MPSFWEKRRGFGKAPRPAVEPTRSKFEKEKDREQAQETISNKVRTALEVFDRRVQQSTGIEHSILAAMWDVPYAELESGEGESLNQERPYIGNTIDGFRFEKTGADGKKVMYRIGRYDKQNGGKKLMTIHIEYGHKSGDGDFDDDRVTVAVSLNENRPEDYSDCLVRRRKIAGKSHREDETLVSVHTFDPKDRANIAVMTIRRDGMAKSEAAFCYRDTTNSGEIKVTGGVLNIVYEPRGSHEPDDIMRSKPITKDEPVEWESESPRHAPQCRVQNGFLVVNSNKLTSSKDLAFPTETSLAMLFEDLAPGFFSAENPDAGSTASATASNRLE